MNLSSSLIRSRQPSGELYKTKLPSTIENAKQVIADDATAPIDYVGETSDQATIAVLDLFRNSTNEYPMHGDEVNAVILNHGFEEKDTAKIRLQFSQEANAHISNLLYEDGPESFGDRLDAYITLSASHALARTNGVMEHLITDENSKISTINQSQGESRYGVYHLLKFAAYWNGELSEVGAKMVETLGLENPSQEELLQALADRTESVLKGSEQLKNLQNEHSGLVQELRNRGVLFVTSAGNNQDDVEAARAQGIEMSEAFDDDITSVGPKLVVGALDTKRTATTDDDELADFSSRYEAVNILADGVQVTTLPQWLNTGTSFAAPAVAAQAEKHARLNRGIPADERQAEVSKLFPRTDGYRLLR